MRCAFRTSVVRTGTIDPARSALYGHGPRHRAEVVGEAARRRRSRSSSAKPLVDGCVDEYLRVVQGKTSVKRQSQVAVDNDDARWFDQNRAVAAAMLRHVIPGAFHRPALTEGLQIGHQAADLDRGRFVEVNQRSLCQWGMGPIAEVRFERNNHARGASADDGLHVGREGAFPRAASATDRYDSHVACSRWSPVVRQRNGHGDKPFTLDDGGIPPLLHQRDVGWTFPRLSVT